MLGSPRASETNPLGPRGTLSAVCKGPSVLLDVGEDTKPSGPSVFSLKSKAGRSSFSGATPFMGSHCDQFGFSLPLVGFGETSFSDSDCVGLAGKTLAWAPGPPDAGRRPSPLPTVLICASPRSPVAGDRSGGSCVRLGRASAHASVLFASCLAGALAPSFLPRDVSGSCSSAASWLGRSGHRFRPSRRGVCEDSVDGRGLCAAGTLRLRDGTFSFSFRGLLHAWF